MRKYITTFIIVFIFIFAYSAANALDYKDWIPLLPERINGIDKAGDPDGANMERGDESWSTVQQDYSDSSGKEISLTIVGGKAPQLQQFQKMKQFTMETEEKLVKTTKVSGYEAVLDLHKKKGSGTIVIQVQERTLVVIDVEAVSNKEELISLAEDVPLSDIAAQD